jgi:predicted amidohydrolase YtcJ
MIICAAQIITMDPTRPTAKAVAVRGDRIVGVGSLEELQSEFADVGFELDERFAGSVLIAGLIDQHLHPVLGASTLTTEVIAPEDWVMPGRTFTAASDAAEYDRRLDDANRRLPPGEWLYSWGYHRLWHGEMSRARLDLICGDRPTAIWQRSCHEWFLNTAALAALGVTKESMAGHGAASEQLDVDLGHFWENGWMVLLARVLMPVFLTEDRLRNGLMQLVAYLHMNGVTGINEPGILWAIEPWNLYQEILGADDVPFATTFLVDGRTQCVRKIDPAGAVDDANAQIARGVSGKVSMVAGQVKLFADGAIISQLMQMRDGYLGADGLVNPDHHGEWIMEPHDLRRYFDAYWDAGWQIHVHVNGDLGLDVLLDIIDDAMQRNPRIDHRTTVVHFANSTEDQVVRIAKLGAIVSANPYYPVGFADKYSEVGLGPARADVMVRSASVLRHGIPLSFHSDLPMGPSDPLAMAGFAVNRMTHSGRVAGPEQRIDVDAALRAVTIGAAHSWRREDDLGTIEVGKMANFTVLADDPRMLAPIDIGRTRVLGTIFGGRWFPVPEAHQEARIAAHAPAPQSSMIDLETGCGHGCGCEVAQVLADHLSRRGAAA